MANFKYFVSIQWLVALLVVGFLLSACGGGGGGSGDSARSPRPVVFVADKDIDGKTELYVALDDGSGVVKISGTLIDDGDVASFMVSPDGNKVAFRADADTDGVMELYVVDSDSGNRIKVSQGISGNADVGHTNGGDSFWWSPDSTRLVYMADTDIDEITELFLVNADGSDHHKISGTVGSPPSVRIGQAEWSPDSRYVAYYVRTLAPFYSGYAVDRIAINTHDTTIGGRNSVRVSGSPIANHDWISLMYWSPDSTRIAYSSYENTVDVREMYIAVAGVTLGHTRVNVPISSNEGIHFRAGWSRDSRYLLYSVNGPAGATHVGLYTHDTLNATPRNGVKISGNLASGGNIYDFSWASNDTQIIYSGDQDTDEKAELYYALPGVASSSVKLSPVLPAFSDVSSVSLSPDGSRILYIADPVVDNYYDVYTMPIAGGASVKVTHDRDPGVLLSDNNATWSPNGQYIHYEVRGGDRGLFVTGATSNAGAHKVSGSVVPDDTTTVSYSMIDRTAWSADGQRLIFSAGSWANSIPRDIYAVDRDGNQPQAITGAMVTDGEAWSFDLL